MNTNVWQESAGPMVAESLRQEARRWHTLHQPPASLEDWEALRSRLREKMHALAGTFPARVPLEVREHGTLEMDGYRIVNVTYQSRADLRVTGNLFIPDGKGPLPAILGMHGHWSQGRLAARVAARGHTLAKEGFVFLNVDAFGSGERCMKPGTYEYHGLSLGGALMSIGETLLGMQVYDNMRGIDLLQSLGYVDGDRIGATGASGGGNQTMWLAAFDNRVKASVPVVSVGTFESYVTCSNCMCETLPGGLPLMGEWAVLAQVAPNALLILNALQDGNAAFKIHEAVRSYNAAREIYRLYGIEEKLAYKAIDLPHGYWPEMRNHALAWFKLWLMDEGHGLPRGVPDIPDLPEKDLMCFPDLNRDKQVQSIPDYTTTKSQEIKQRLLEDTGALKRGEKVEALADVLGMTPPQNVTSPGLAVRGRDSGLAYEKFPVESSRGLLIPCACFRQPESGNTRLVIAVHPKGKAQLADNPRVKAFLAAGATVCFADVRHVGENFWMRSPDDPLTQAARAALWLGRTLIGEWADDLLAIRSSLAQKYPSAGCELLAFGDASLAALVASSVSHDFTRVTVSDMLATYVLEGRPHVQDVGILIPNVLAWGDVSLMVALANCPVSVHAPVKPHGDVLSETELQAWREETMAFARRLGGGADVEVSTASLEPGVRQEN